MFNKIVMINFSEGDLDPQYWTRIDRIAKDKVFVRVDSEVRDEDTELPQQLASADALLLKLGDRADPDRIALAPNLRYIGMFGTGYGHIDTLHAASRGILVTNIPGYATEGVAEFVFAALLERMREIERAKQQARNANYSESTFTGTEIKGKSFGVLGLGAIGARVAQLALRGFEASVFYWSRNRKPEQEAIGITYRDVDRLLEECTILSLHLAFNEDTRNFLSETRLRAIQPGAIVINTAPMELVDIPALEARLKNDDISFIFDHSDDIPADAQRLSRYPNCLVYPPIAYTTNEATVGKQEIFVTNLERFLEGSPTNKVN